MRASETKSRIRRADVLCIVRTYGRVVCMVSVFDAPDASTTKSFVRERTSQDDRMTHQTTLRSQRRHHLHPSSPYNT